MQVKAILDDGEDEIEVEVGNPDPGVDDPSLSFSTITATATAEGPSGPNVVNLTSSENGLGTSSDHEEGDFTGLTLKLEQSATSTTPVAKQPIKTLIGSSMDGYKIPKRSSQPSQATQSGTSAAQSGTGIRREVSCAASSSVLLSRFKRGLPLQPEGIVFSLCGPGGFERHGTDLNGKYQEQLVHYSVRYLILISIEMWSEVVGKVQFGRSQVGVDPLPCNSLNAFALFGLEEPFVMRLLEQLPQVENCKRYSFKYYKPFRKGSWDRVKKVLFLYLLLPLNGHNQLIFGALSVYMLTIRSWCISCR